jgi:HPt (histidine-containing phosphotransfer) domain-containing protein
MPPFANDRLPVWKNTKLFLKNAENNTTSNGYQPNSLFLSIIRSGNCQKGEIMSNDLPVIDISEALKRAMGDVDFLQMMLAEFQRTIPDFLSRFNQALQFNDMDSLARDAHQFKGTAANLGAKIIAAVALELEQIGKTGNSKNGESTYAELQEAVTSFNHHLARIEWSTINTG